MKRLLASAGALAIALCIGHADAATFKPIAKGKSLVMSGMIVEGDDKRLYKSYVDSCNKRKYCPERVFLNSNGGQARAGFDTAIMIDKLHLDTVVGKADVCASSCFFIFAAGKVRVVRSTGLIGVHNLWDKNTGKVMKEDTLLASEIMRAMGVPEPIIAKFLITPPTDIAWLHAADAGDWIQVIK